MTASSTSPVRRVERVRHELHFRDVQVARVEPFGAEFVRVVFAGESLGNFVSLGFDDHLKFICPDPAAAPDAPPARRDYTPRAWNTERRELTVDFGLGEGEQVGELAGVEGFALEDELENGVHGEKRGKGSVFRRAGGRGNREGHAVGVS